MDFNEAGRMLGLGTGVRTRFAEVRDEFLGRHAMHSNAHGLASSAFAEIEQGLATLARLGHQFHLVPAEAAPALEFPKMLVHRLEAPGELLVHSAEEETAARSAGWTSVGETPATTNASS